MDKKLSIIFICIMCIMFFISGCSSANYSKPLQDVAEKKDTYMILENVDDVKKNYEIIQESIAPGVQYNTIEYLTKWYEANEIEVVAEENVIYQEFQQEIAQAYKSYQFIEFANGDAVLIIYFDPGWGPEPNKPEIVKEAAEKVIKKTDQKYFFDNNYINWVVLFSNNIETMINYHSECENGRYPDL